MIKYDKQVKFAGKGYLDPKTMPVATKAALNSITMANDAFEGMERVVLKDETMGNKTTKYVFRNNAWVLTSPTISGDDVE